MLLTEISKLAICQKRHDCLWRRGTSCWEEGNQQAVLNKALKQVGVTIHQINYHQASTAINPHITLVVIESIGPCWSPFWCLVRQTEPPCSIFGSTHRVAVVVFAVRHGAPWRAAEWRLWAMGVFRCSVTKLTFGESTSIWAVLGFIGITCITTIPHHLSLWESVHANNFAWNSQRSKGWFAGQIRPLMALLQISGRTFSWCTQDMNNWKWSFSRRPCLTTAG